MEKVFLLAQFSPHMFAAYVKNKPVRNKGVWLGKKGGGRETPCTRTTIKSSVEPDGQKFIYGTLRCLQMHISCAKNCSKAIYSVIPPLK